MEPTSQVQGQVATTKRYFTDGMHDPLDQIEWTCRTAQAGDFIQENVEAPVFWSDKAVGITAKLYFATVHGVREWSVRTMIERVARKITIEGCNHNYFAVDINHPTNPAWGDEAKTFYHELCYLLVHQMAAFNTPVWLNVGVPGRKQCCSACFLLRVDDTMLGERFGGKGDHSIMDWVATEAAIFKMGAGSGVSLSALRGSMEKLSTGGTASGPTSYMRLGDANAGTLKSGGAHRRAAKMVILNVDHPDIEDFIDVKRREDERMRILAAAGLDVNPFTSAGEKLIAETTSFQNENISVGASEAFMQAAVDMEPGSPRASWDLTARTTGETIKTIDASELLDEIADAAWTCGDPGMVFLDTVNAWHTTPSLGPITTCNPCLVGESLVDTSEGRIRIDTLAETWATGQQLPLAFGFDQETSLPALKRITKAWMTRMVTELVEIRTEKGCVIRLTPDHKVLTRDHGRSSDGRYVEAGDLVPGQSLRKIGRFVNHQRSSRRHILMRVTDEAPNGMQAQAIWMWEQAFGPITEGMEVHHLNEDPTDDRLSNLELIDSGTHQSFHSSGERNGRFIHADAATLLEVYEKAEEISRHGEATMWSWGRAIKALGLQGSVPVCVHGRIRGMQWSDFAKWIVSQRSLVNDRVLSIEHIVLDKPVPVYDITVDGVHNFGVATEGVEHTIVVSNCAETWLNDDSSCNLASLNLISFLSLQDGLEVERFRAAVDVMITAMDITCSFSELPTPAIERNTRELRQLGLGYANLGAALMAQGMPYDSDEGRDWAASVTALMTGRAYRRSAELAIEMGAYERFEENAESHLEVIKKHRSHLPLGSEGIWHEAYMDWSQAYATAVDHGFRNSQTTVLAPTGTISHLMDCDTTGIEPDFALVKTKGLAGGGSLKIVNQTVERALRNLGYGSGTEALLDHLVEHGYLPTVPIGAYLKMEHASVFATANEISPSGHLGMVAAVQPFLSGAPSKTINLAESATREDIKQVYIDAWRAGCKAVSIFRDGSKATQVLTNDSKVRTHAAEDTQEATSTSAPTPDGPPGPARLRLPAERQSITRKLSVGGHEGYITAGQYPDGQLGEFFLTGMGKEGSFLQGMMGAWSIACSVLLQFGGQEALETLARKFIGMEFEPRGATGDPEIPSAKSLPDYVFRWLVLRYGDVDLQEELGVLSKEVKARMTARLDEQEAITPGGIIASLANGNGHYSTASAKPCRCGGLMYPSGVCFTCSSCGTTSGCG